MTKTENGSLIDTLLLLALPASGKSEVRRYLATLSRQQCETDFHIGPTVQLDDFPYVHIMRRIDDELHGMGENRLFFESPARPFRQGIEWGSLIQLLNEDYADLRARKIAEPASAAEHLFERLERARQAAATLGGIRTQPKLDWLSNSVRTRLADRLEAEARELLAAKHQAYPDALEGKTVVIEFARGGPQDATMPLAPPFGYQFSLQQLAPEILERSSILYVWVTPEESRRKNHERTDPNDPGSILHHGVPIDVMLNDYGCDDMEYLLEQRGGTGVVEVLREGKRHLLRVGRFDNRRDKTSFIRAPQAQWAAAEVAALHEGLKQAFAQIAGR